MALKNAFWISPAMAYRIGNRSRRGGIAFAPFQMARTIWRGSISLKLWKPEKLSLSYYDKPYFLAPVKTGGKAYALLRETLRRPKKVGIAKVVIRTRQHLAALLVRGLALILSLLRFPYELREPTDLKLPEAKMSKLRVTEREKNGRASGREMVEPFDPSKYRDECRDDILALIRKKLKAGDTRSRRRKTRSCRLAGRWSISCAF